MAGPTRRRLLVGGIFGATILAAGSLGLGLRRGANHAVPALQAFDARAFRTLQAVAARICPFPTEGFPSSGDIGVAKLVDAHVATLHPNDQRELNQALWLLENALAGLVLEGRPQPFSTASPAAQDRALASWRTSSIGVLRRAFKALRSLCASAYYGDPRAYAAIGYPGPPNFGQSRAPALQPVQLEEPEPEEVPT